jgi:hypothetical protein
MVSSRNTKRNKEIKNRIHEIFFLQQNSFDGIISASNKQWSDSAS